MRSNSFRYVVYDGATDASSESGEDVLGLLIRYKCTDKMLESCKLIRTL